jgi:hypothetical protein
VVGAAPSTQPAQGATAERAKAPEPPKPEPAVAARAEPPEARAAGKREPRVSREAPAVEGAAQQKVARKERASAADDEFDELFGTKKKPTREPPPEPTVRPTTYVPPATVTTQTTPERLAQSDIMQVVLANKAAIVKCVNEQKQKDPGASGKLVMRWTIQPSGKTTAISCQTPEFRSTHVARCISGLIKGWSFPRHQKQGEPIDFPFTF